MLLKLPFPVLPRESSSSTSSAFFHAGPVLELAAVTLLLLDVLVSLLPSAAWAALIPLRSLVRKLVLRTAVIVF